MKEFTYYCLERLTKLWIWVDAGQFSNSIFILRRVKQRQWNEIDFQHENTILSIIGYLQFVDLIFIIDWTFFCT